MNTKDFLQPFYEAGSTLGIALYVHLECLDDLLERLQQEGRVIQPNRIKYWTPGDLAVQVQDIHACDQCKREFELSDSGYISCFVTSPEELAKLLEAKYGIPMSGCNKKRA